MDGIRYINLQTLIELKIASGMTNSERLKDLADVIELIKALSLPVTFGENLNPFVQEKFAELWKDAHPRTKRYITLWRNKWLTSEAKSLQDMVDGLQSAADQLRAMLADGVTLEPDGGTSDDYAHLVTTDPTIAKKYDMHADERNFGVVRIWRKGMKIRNPRYDEIRGSKAALVFACDCRQNSETNSGITEDRAGRLAT